MTGWEPGDAVAVYGPWGCGRCRAVPHDARELCEHAAEIGAAGGGLGRDGGMAEYMLVPTRGCSCRSATSTRATQRRSPTPR